MIAALLAAALLGAAPPAPGPPLEVLDAGRVDYDVARERGVATGGVTLRRGAVTLHAAEASYDLRTGEVDAWGGVLLTQPGRAVAAERMHAVLDGPYEAHQVVAFLKDAPLDLSRCRTVDDVRRLGHTRVELGGAEIRGDTSRHDEVRFDVEDARVTLCDCGAAPPSWEIHASHASVAPGRRAILSWPVFYVTPRLIFFTDHKIPVLSRLLDYGRPVPVLVLPIAYLPLSERQSGLLLPELSWGGSGGFGVSQPLFLTFGRSWDATVTADYVVGPDDKTVQSLGHGVKGLGTNLELRWAPAEGVRGQVRFSLLRSLIHLWPETVALPPGQERLALSAFHEQRFSESTSLRVELGLVGDPLYLQDFTGDALLRASEYRRSTVALTHRRDDLLFEADASYLLALQNLDAAGCAAPPCGRAPFGLFGGDLDTFHRLPSASVTLLPVPLAGPVHLSGSLGVARFAPLSGVTGDEGVDGVGAGERGWAGGTIGDPGERDGRWQGPSAAGPGERLAATRAVARGELRAPFAVGRALSVEPWVTGTAAGYAFDAGPGALAQARASGGVALSTSLERTFGEGAGRLRHVVEPRVAWVAGTNEVGPALPSYAYDELDVASLPVQLGPSGVVAVQRTLSAAPGSFSQLQLSVRNRLLAPAGALSVARLELTLGQDVDLAGGGHLAETWAQTALRVGLFGLDGTARFRAFGSSAPPGSPAPDPPSRVFDAFTVLTARASLADRRGDELHASLISVGAGGSPRLLAGIEPLFDDRPTAAGAAAAGVVGGRARVSGATIAYDASFNPRELAAPLCPGKPTGPHVYQHAASLVWDSPCRCWKAGVTALMSECDARPRFGFVVDLSQLAAGR